MEVSAQQYLEFIENKGQWPSAIKFQAQTVAGAFALQNNGYRVLVHNPQDLAALNTHPREKNHVATTPENFDGVLHSHAYEVKFLNANPNPTIVPEKIQPSYNNYFIGNDSTKWASDCKIYKAVVYKDLYPGIDIRYYTNDAQLKYDIIVHPGADVSKIALYIEGADGVVLQIIGALLPLMMRKEIFMRAVSCLALLELFLLAMAPFKLLLVAVF